MQIESNELLQKAGKMLLLPLSSTFIAVAALLIPVQVLNKIGVMLWAQITAVLFGAGLYLSAWIFILYRKLKAKPDFKPYIHKSEKGYWQHKTTEEKICAACKLDDVLSPLHRYHDGWRCPKHPTTVGRDVIKSEPPTAPNYHMI